METITIHYLTKKLKAWLLILAVVLSSCESEFNGDTFFDETYGIVARSDKQLKSVYLDDVKVFEFRYNDSGLLTEQDFHYNDTLITEFFSYNASGKITERVSNYLHYHYVYSNGRLTEQYTVNTLNADWRPKLVFQYNRQGRIERAETYFNDEPDGYVLYTYDERGNTTSRKTYWYSEPDDLLVSEYQLQYDDHINPLTLPSQYPIDILQSNNPVYHYYYAIHLSSFPLGQQISYKYDADGYPVSKVINIDAVDWQRQPSGVYRYEYYDR